MKTTTFIRVLVLAALTSCLAATCVKAEVGLGEVWGAVWTIGDTIVGTTTITPAYMVTYWDYQVKIQGTNEPGSSYRRMTVRADIITKTYFYNFKLIGQYVNTNSTAPFPVEFIGRYNYDARVALKGGYGLGTTLLDYKCRVWLASVVRTGLWPDNGPWTVFLKTSGHPFWYDWKNYTYRDGSVRNYWGSAEVSEFGNQQITIGFPTCMLDYPFALGRDFY